MEINILKVFLATLALVGLALAKAATRLPCDIQVDAMVIFEIPNETSSFEAFQRFFLGLFRAVDPRPSCIQLGFITTSKEARVIANLKCNNARSVCLSNATRNIDELVPRFHGHASKNEVDSRQNKLSLLEAIRLAKLQLTSKDNGARSEVKKTLVLVLTNPFVKEDSFAADALANVRGQHIEVIAIGVGETYRWQEYLTGLVSSNQLMLHVNDLSELAEQSSVWTIDFLIKSKDTAGLIRHEERLEGTILNDKPLKTNRGQLYEVCENVVDIAFLLDSSNSIRDDYNKAKLFIEKLATRFGISKEGSHAGVVVFSAESQVKTFIRLDQFYDLEAFRREVAQLPFYGFVTRIDLALKEANRYLFTKEAGARNEVKKLVFLITDGRQNPGLKFGKRLDPVQTASPLHERGIPIYAIGIGNRVRKHELVEITRSPSNVYTVKNFDQLLDDVFVELVSEQSCTHHYRKLENNTGATGNTTNTTDKPATLTREGTGRNETESLKNETAPGKTDNVDKSNCTTDSNSNQCGCGTCCGCGCSCSCNAPAPIYLNIFSAGNNFVIQTTQLKDKSETSNDVDGTDRDNSNPTEQYLNLNANSPAQMTTKEMIQLIKSKTCGGSMNENTLKLLEAVLSSCKTSNKKTNL
eukprot:gene5127-5775_t